MSHLPSVAGLSCQPHCEETLYNHTIINGVLHTAFLDCLKIVIILLYSCKCIELMIT